MRMRKNTYKNRKKIFLLCTQGPLNANKCMNKNNSTMHLKIF